MVIIFLCTSKMISILFNGQPISCNDSGVDILSLLNFSSIVANGYINKNNLWLDFKPSRRDDSYLSQILHLITNSDTCLKASLLIQISLA